MCAAPMEMITVGGQRAGEDVLGQWADGLGRRQKGKPECGLLRFAFYGRLSTEDWQDPESSRARQLQQEDAGGRARGDRGWVLRHW
jgi:site-specific DNA recombinase